MADDGLPGLPPFQLEVARMFTPQAGHCNGMQLSL